MCISLQDYDSFTLENDSQGHIAQVNDVAYSEKEKIFASCSSD
jgi:hypothetical protein